jgi:hypothetical protein
VPGFAGVHVTMSVLLSRMTEKFPVASDGITAAFRGVTVGTAFVRVKRMQGCYLQELRLLMANAA